MRGKKKQYFHNQIAISSNRIKTAWKIIKDNSGIPQANNIITKINCDDRTLSNTKDIANAFNKYYTQIAAKLGTENGDANKTLKLLRNTKFDNIMQMEIIPDIEAQIKITIMSLKSKNSTGYDEISNRILKHCVKSVSKPLTHIFNNSLFTRIFPERS